MIPYLTFLGLAAVLGGFVLMAIAKAKRLGERWEFTGLWTIFGGFGLIMLSAVLAMATAA
jgi:hypothetical protein